MADLHPAHRRYVWNPMFWLKVWKNRRSWIPCERCGFLSECLPYGHTVRANYEALARDGYAVPKQVNGPEDKKVCFGCCMEMRQSHGDMVGGNEILRRWQSEDMAACETCGRKDQRLACPYCGRRNCRLCCSVDGSETTLGACEDTAGCIARCSR